MQSARKENPQFNVYNFSYSQNTGQKKNELKGKMNKISRKKHGSNQNILMRLPLSFYDSESDAYVHNLSSEGHLEL